MTKKCCPNFFIFNPKSYLYGEALLELAELADSLVEETISIFVTGPYVSLPAMKARTKQIIVTAQHLDGIEPGAGMGKVLPASLVDAGVDAVFLNHAEKPLTLAELVEALKATKRYGLLSIVCANSVEEARAIVCANSVEEARAIAMLNPDIILCEPTELIGTGKRSDLSYIKETNQAIKSVNPDILIMQAAGISSAEDVYITLKAGADGTGCTSGIVKAPSPKAILEEMVAALKQAVKER
ncbi:triose-phosphate isomerase [Streptococcus ictaluri]|uniref:Triose-phosphate isomerase n=1 Tax=Streptococcus ictaluri 707-05 TaxID=764299 RepID=G5K558_9STRE|nr:triose-phosphate isomerase [Streptococcus ictaluri]EHI68857.1 triose-phosphate isomerase [Streptococcus ictaluri 707-05]